MNDERDVAVLHGGEPSEPADHRVLLEEAVHAALAGAHHELQVVQHHVTDVVDVRRVGHRLAEGEGRGGGRSSTASHWSEGYGVTTYTA